MRLLIQRATDPVPYLGAYVRLAGIEAEPARCTLVLPPAGPAPAEEPERAVLTRLLALVAVLGDPAGGTPIRQYWLGPELRFEGRMGHELAARHAAEVERVAERIGAEWERFVANALARLRGEPRGDSHLAYAGEGWDAERPTVRVTAWPPLADESLPVLE